MLLNIETVLDKGEIALISCCNDNKILKDIQDTYFKATFNKDLLDIAEATFMIKCPLFVQLNLSKFDLKIIPTQTTNTLEAYIPNVSEIGAKSVEDKKRIYKHFDQAVNALILNSKGFTLDGCDPFISQTIMPISVYTKLIVHGNLNTWGAYIKQINLPSPIDAYRVKIREILSANWTGIR